MQKELSKEYLYKDSRYSKLVEAFSEPFKYDYREENKVIQDLIDFNNSKFEEIRNILENEIYK